MSADLPSEACPDIGRDAQGFFVCKKHNIALGSPGERDLEKCKTWGTKPDWYPCWYRPGERPPP